MIDTEKDIHIPAQLALVGIQHFPFKNRNVLNFFIQGIAVFVISALLGYFAESHIIFICK
jgi:hypothetical protein